MQSPTIYDVARVAGVSISTVSLAINRPARVSASSRERVLAAVRDLGYTPKTEMVSLARRGVGRIGVLAPFTSYPSFAERLNGVLEEVATNALDLEIAVFDHESAAISSSPLLDSVPLTGRVDGLILMGITPSEHAIQRIRDAGIPMVLIGTGQIDTSIATVTHSDFAGGVLAARHLLSRGFTEFAFLGERQQSADWLSQSQQRLRGFRSHLESSNIDASSIVATVAENTIESAASAASLFMRNPRRLGILAHSDLLAAGALQAVKAGGRSSPEDVGIVGFDDSPIASALGLTSVSQPLRESGRLGLKLLNELLRNGPTAPTGIALGVHLVQRSST